MSVSLQQLPFSWKYFIHSTNIYISSAVCQARSEDCRSRMTDAILALRICSCVQKSWVAQPFQQGRYLQFGLIYWEAANTHTRHGGLEQSGGRGLLDRACHLVGLEDFGGGVFDVSLEQIDGENHSVPWGCHDEHMIVVNTICVKTDHKNEENSTVNLHDPLLSLLLTSSSSKHL